MLTVEILVTDDTASRGKRMLAAMRQAAPEDVSIRKTNRYHGESDWLMLYGAGGESRFPAWLKHRAKGKRTITWDLGYWSRPRTLRVSVDDLHPQRWIYRVPSVEGRNYPGELRDDFDPNGPVVFAGMGKKSMRRHGNWDQLYLAEFATPSMIIRPKPDRIAHTNLPPIEAVLHGVSKVISHHSNVAVDGIVAGIPHLVVDGAALALEPTRDPIKRREFLDRLASFQWRCEEATQCWQFLRSFPDV